MLAMVRTTSVLVTTVLSRLPMELQMDVSSFGNILLLCNAYLLFAPHSLRAERGGLGLHSQDSQEAFGR